MGEKRYEKIDNVEISDQIFEKYEFSEKNEKKMSEKNSSYECIMCESSIFESFVFMYQKQ